MKENEPNFKTFSEHSDICYVDKKINYFVSTYQVCIHYFNLIKIITYVIYS